MSISIGPPWACRQCPAGVQGADRANKTLKNVKGARVKDQEVTVDNGKVTGYMVVLKLMLVLE